MVTEQCLVGKSLWQSQHIMLIYGKVSQKAQNVCQRASNTQAARNLFSLILSDCFFFCLVLFFSVIVKRLPGEAQ